MGLTAGTGAPGVVTGFRRSSCPKGSLVLERCSGQTGWRSQQEVSPSAPVYQGLVLGGDRDHNLNGAGLSPWTAASCPAEPGHSGVSGGGQPGRSMVQGRWRGWEKRAVGAAALPHGICLPPGHCRLSGTPCPWEAARAAVWNQRVFPARLFPSHRGVGAGSHRATGTARLLGAGARGPVGGHPPLLSWPWVCGRACQGSPMCHRSPPPWAHSGHSL